MRLNIGRKITSRVLVSLLMQLKVSRETIAANRGEHGSHWAVIIFNMVTSEVLYNDSLAWPVPKNLHMSLTALLDAIENAYKVCPDIFMCHIAHNHQGSISGCAAQCLCLPYQGSNMDVCGLAALLCVLLLTAGQIFYIKL